MVCNRCGAKTKAKFCKQCADEMYEQKRLWSFEIKPIERFGEI